MDGHAPAWRPPKPTSLPEMRRSLIAHLGTTPFLKAIEKAITNGDHLLSSTGMPARAAASWVSSAGINQLSQARLLSVGANMTKICVAAAHKLPTFELRPEAHPSPYGLIVFDESLNPPSDPSDEPSFGTVAASWGPVMTPEGVGTYMMFWSAVNHEHVIRFIQERRNLTRREAEQATYRSTHDISLCSERFFLHDDPDPLASPGSLNMNSAGGWMQVVRAAWGMYTARSKRKIAQVNEVPVPRTLRRQAEREGHAHSDVVDVINVHPRLRVRAAREHTTGDHQSGYKIDYRKFVGQHVRWQPYPSRNTVEPIMIADYIQGPDGAPFKNRPKVYRLGEKSQIPTNPLVP